MPKFIEKPEKLMERIGAFETSNKLLDELQQVVGTEENSSNEIANKVVLFIHEKNAKLKEENKELTASALIHIMKAMTKKLKKTQEVIK